MKNVNIIFIVMNVYVLLFFCLKTNAGIENILEKVNKKYQESGYLVMNFKKKLLLSLIEKEKVSEGKIYFYNGKFRLESIEKNKKKMLIIYDNEYIWTAQFPLKDINSPVQIIKNKINNPSVDSQFFLSLIMGSQKIAKNFDIHFDGFKNKKVYYHLIPKKKIFNWDKLNLVVDNKNLRIVEINYVDEIGNKTFFYFSNVTFDKKFPLSLLKFKIPKNSLITETK